MKTLSEKLNRSLYGLKQAAVCWFDKLKVGLLDAGWEQPLPILEPCLFYKDGVICLCYVDDCIFFSRDGSKIAKFIKQIRDNGLALTVENDVYAFLGVELGFGSGSTTCTLTQLA